MGSCQAGVPPFLYEIDSHIKLKFQRDRSPCVALRGSLKLEQQCCKSSATINCSSDLSSY